MSGIYVNPNTKFVGIGTIAPTSRLQVDGNAHFGSNADTDAHTIIGSTSITCSNATGAAALTVNQQGTGKIFELQDSGTARMTVLDGGNVGIGIANPTQKLYVVGDTRIEGNLTVNGTQTVINTDVITTEQLLVTNNGTGPALVVNQTGEQPVVDIQDDGVSVMKIINNGNIGMGTTDPTQRLHVQGSILATTQHLGPAADTSNAPGFSWSGDSNTGIYRPAADAVGVVTGGVERMRVLANGNVGIGTTNPTKQLSIKGSMELGISSGDYQHLRIGGGNASGYIYGAYSKFGDGMHLGYNFYNDNVLNQISNSGGSTSRISCGYGKVEIHTGGINTEPSTLGLIVTNGNVGIGITNPSVALQTNSTVQFGNLTFYASIASAATAGGTYTRTINIEHDFNNGALEEHYIKIRTIGLCPYAPSGYFCNIVEYVATCNQGNTGITVFTNNKYGPGANNVTCNNPTTNSTRTTQVLNFGSNFRFFTTIESIGYRCILSIS